MNTASTARWAGALALLLTLSVAPAQAAAPSSIALPGTARVDGVIIAELSGLAWDADEQVLYAVSDQGLLLQFDVTTDGDTLTAVRPLRATPLFDPDHVLASDAPRFDAEGLSVRNASDGKPGNTELLIALEGKPSRIARFNPRGEALGLLDVPPPVADLAQYRKKGHGLEAVTWSPRWGIMTAPESPLRQHAADQHTVYAAGAHWSFARSAEDSRLKGLDLLPGTRLLVLERVRGEGKKSQAAALRSVDLAACTEARACPVHTLVTLPVGPENFEGMTLLAPHQALLVSDNGGKAGTATVFTLVPLP